MLEGKCEKIEFQKTLSSPCRKIEVSKSKKKMLKKKELREMDNQKRDKWKHNEKWSFMKWSLVKITLKHNLGLLILSLGTQAYITCCKSLFWLNVDT